jgi:hypothetical protein
MFFAETQHKLLYAVTGKTVAEIILHRAEANKPNMALILERQCGTQAGYFLEPLRKHHSKITRKKSLPFLLKAYQRDNDYIKEIEKLESDPECNY